MIRFVFAVLFFTGCAHSLDDTICHEACGRLAAKTGHDLDVAAWYVVPRTCGCRFDDGKIVFTREIPQ